ncbi:hypothetical protein [Mucilaginibacter sp. HD30]
MKKLIFLLPLLILFAGCMKTNQKEYDPPPAPFGTFSGKFTHTHTDPVTSAKDVTTANIQLAMATTGFMLASDDVVVHANGSGEFLGDDLTLDFSDPNYSTAGAINKGYLQGSYSYIFNGTNFKLTKSSANDVDEYVLVKL